MDNPRGSRPKLQVAPAATRTSESVVRRRTAFDDLPAPPPAVPSLTPQSMPRRDSTQRMPAVTLPLVFGEDAPTSANQTRARVLDDMDFENASSPVVLELGAERKGHGQVAHFAPLQRPQTGPRPITVPTAPAWRRSIADVETASIMPGAHTEPVATAVRVVSMEAKRPGIFAFAGFGLPPEKLLETPAYALRVMTRRSILKKELAVARKRRSPDISLYEAALVSADASAYRNGVAVMVLGIVVLLSILVAVAALH